MAAIGKKQINYLASHAGVFSAVVVPDALTRSLVKRGLMVSLSDKTDGFLSIAPEGYRAIADALEAGKIVRPPLADWGKAKP